MQFLLETGGFINLIWDKHQNHRHGDALNHNDVMLRLRRLSVTARPIGRNYGKSFIKKTLPMALRITSKDYENLYVTSYFSFHGDKNTLNLNSSKKYRPTSGKLCPRKKHSTRENSLIFTREILTSTRENVRMPEKICEKVGEKNKFPPRKKLKK